MLPLKILTWNVEHFYGGGGSDTATRQKRRNRLKRIVELVKEEDPDVFGISEVSSGFVYQAMVEAFPNHTFNITTGQQSQQILIGVRSGLGAFFTQKDEFKRNNIYLRPGALLTVHDNGVHIPILFVHLKSMTAPEGFGLRDAMYERIFSLKNALDDAAQAMTGNDDESANFIVLGDYNTMGMKYYRNIGNISLNREIEVLEKRMRSRDMRMASKSHPNSYWPGSSSSIDPSPLDHVFVADHMMLKQTAGKEVEVKGWAELNTDNERDEWAEKWSDHAPLVFTVTGV